MNPKFLV